MGWNDPTHKASGTPMGFGREKMIEFKNVSKTYSNGTHALRNVNLTVEDGEFVFIVGSSGAGKSTFLKLIMCEEMPNEGEIIVNDTHVSSLKKREIPYLRRMMGIVFQDFRLIDNMTVYENVAFAMHVVGASARDIRKRVPYILGLVGLQKKMKAYPSQLSGGEQQRVAIARSLASGAKTFLADEPTGNLDVANTENIMAILKSLAHNDGYCVIVVTHDMEVAKEADTVFRMVDGTVTLER